MQIAFWELLLPSCGIPASPTSLAAQVLVSHCSCLFSVLEKQQGERSPGFQGFSPDRPFLPGWAYLQEEAPLTLHTHNIVSRNGWQLHRLQQQAIGVVYSDVLVETFSRERHLKIRAILDEGLGCI